MKNPLCPYYTNSQDITSYMVAQLQIKQGDCILEPSAGEGIFIDAIVNGTANGTANKTANETAGDIVSETAHRGHPIHIDALDIDAKSVSVLEKKYSGNTSISVRQTDTLFDEQLDFFSASGGHYDKVIGNPPYGAWQDYERRELLKKKYAGQYVKETYSLFLLRCVSVLKQHGILSFIIPDTYLFLNMHSKLRDILLTKTKIREILIFPSKFFPGINFGYSNLSIITLERCDEDAAQSNTIRVIKGFRSSNEFAALLGDALPPKHLKVFHLKQSDILKNPQSRFILTEENNIKILNSALKLGDVADVVTGFYTGDNKRFIRVLNENVKGAKGYQNIGDSAVFMCNSIDGIDTQAPGFVPYIKSSSKRKYLRGEDEWFVQWDKETVQFYRNDKKARFQNSSFYFHTGIGIPMVKSSVVHAFLMRERIFDQSIVGIFPKSDDDLYYLLALINSDTMNELIHIINPTANNSANYIKLLPFIKPSAAAKKEIDSMVEKILVILANTEKLDANVADAKEALEKATAAKEGIESMAKESEAMALHASINAAIKEIYSFHNP